MTKPNDAATPLPRARSGVRAVMATAQQPVDEAQLSMFFDTLYAIALRITAREAQAPHTDADSVARAIPSDVLQTAVNRQG